MRQKSLYYVYVPVLSKNHARTADYFLIFPAPFLSS